MLCCFTVIKMKWFKQDIDTLLHCNMCFVGGFLGAYAILLRGGNFGSAQTANLIHLILHWKSGSALEIVARLLALAVFVVAIVAAFLLPKYVKKDARRICLLVEAAGLMIAGLLPAKMNDMLALLPIFFITAFQWGNFSGAKGYNSATIFSTNNLKQMILGWTEYIRTKNPKEKEKALFYTATLTFFHVGVLGGLLAVSLWGIYSAFACLVPLGCAWVLVEVNLAQARRRSGVEADACEGAQTLAVK